jgi:NSS family neurotransmitter:Na+ symporter
VLVTLPLAFARMPFGAVAAVAFFALLFVAALASAISILELVVAWLIGRAGLRRGMAVLMSGAACWLLGLATVFSFGPWRDWRPLAAIPAFAQSSVFDLIDHLASNLLLPLGGLLLSLFAVIAASPRFLSEELGLSRAGAGLLRFMLAVVTPAAILAVTMPALL